jgi:hypothetical protein
MMDPLYYHAYTIGAPETHYKIDVTVTRCRAHVCSSEILSVSPNSGLAVSETMDAKVELIGSYASVVAPIPFDDVYLLVPSRSNACDGSSHREQRCRERQQGHPSEWLYVDKHLVDASGLTCDRIGVSYTAFRSQSNRCRGRVGDCLNNQIEVCLTRAHCSWLMSH